jgi:hypothetical protein
VTIICEQRKVEELVERFKKSGLDNAHSVWPSNATWIEVNKQTDQSIRENRRIRIDEIACEMNMMNVT